MPEKPRELIFLGDTKRRLQTLPQQVRRDMGHTLHLIQTGDTPRHTKTLTGFSVSVREIRLHQDKEAYRGAYTVSLGDKVYLLHVFHKKSKRGISTPAQDIEIIRRRLQRAERMEAEQNE